MNKDIKDLTDVELKALYFDEMAKVEMAQNNMKVLMQELGQRTQQEPKEGAPVENKEEKDEK